MRTAYHERLDSLTNQLAEMCGLAGVAMERATQALLQADLVLAEQVITDHDQIALQSLRAEESAFFLLALQAPVAGDLRAVVSSIQIVADAVAEGQPTNRRAEGQEKEMGSDAIHVNSV